jgi:hypothetical protein
MFYERRKYDNETSDKGQVQGLSSRGAGMHVHGLRPQGIGQGEGKSKNWGD